MIHGAKIVIGNVVRDKYFDSANSSTPIQLRFDWDVKGSKSGGFKIMKEVLEVIPSKDIPQNVLERYIDLALAQKRLERLSDGTYCMELSDFPGVWANENSAELDFKTIREVLEEWLIFKIEDNDKDIPVLDNIDLNIY